MRVLEGVIYSGQAHTAEPIDVLDRSRCLITILDETVDDLHAEAQQSLDANKQARLSALLALNKARQIEPEQEQELDQLLAQVYELAARKARASRILRQLDEL